MTKKTMKKMKEMKMKITGMKTKITGTTKMMKKISSRLIYKSRFKTTQSQNI